MTHTNPYTHPVSTALAPGRAGEAADRAVGRWITEEADRLWVAERRRVSVAPLTVRRPEVTLVDAYEVQACGITARVAAGGRLVGHKVGLTSVAMQTQMGVTEPDSGVLLEEMLVPDRGDLRAGEFLAPRIEAEIAFLLGEDLRGANVDVASARRAVSQVLLALEVIDTRFGEWRIGLADSVADNASCARVVAGPGVALTTVASLSDEQVVLDVDGIPAATGSGRAVLGDPLAALVWLARRLDELGGEFGGGLRAGDLVLAGAVHASVPLRSGTEIRAHSPHLPTVHLRVR